MLKLASIPKNRHWLLKGERHEDIAAGIGPSGLLSAYRSDSVT